MLTTNGIFPEKLLTQTEPNLKEDKVISKENFPKPENLHVNVNTGVKEVLKSKVNQSNSSVRDEKIVEKPSTKSKVCSLIVTLFSSNNRTKLQLLRRVLPPFHSPQSPHNISLRIELEKGLSLP